MGLTTSGLLTWAGGSERIVYGVGHVLRVALCFCFGGTDEHTRILRQARRIESRKGRWATVWIREQARWQIACQLISTVFWDDYTFAEWWPIYNIQKGLVHTKNLKWSKLLFVYRVVVRSIKYSVCKLEDSTWCCTHILPEWQVESPKSQQLFGLNPKPENFLQSTDLTLLQDFF